MPLTTNKLLAKEAEVTIYIDGDSLTIKYYPHKCTQAMLATLANAGETTGGNMPELTALCELLCELIASWDFFEDVEETIMVPLTTERLADVSLPVLQGVAEAIFRDVSPEATAPQRKNLRR